MNLARTLLAICAFTLLILAGPAHAQYMWLDSNGDGINNSNDVLNAVGVPTTVDVYLDTDHNKDGSLAYCDMGTDYLSFGMYFVNVALTNGTAAFSGFQNLQPMFVNFGQDSSSTEYAHGWGGPSYYPPGTYHVARFTVTLLTSTAPGAMLNIVANNHLSTSVSYEETEFMTSCTGLDFDNTYKLGPNSYASTDWTDTAGLRSPNVATAVSASAAPAGKLAIIAAPNPLNPSTDLKFTTRRAGTVTVRIFDLSGQLVKVVDEAELAAGPHSVRWDGSDARGARVSSGVYFVRVSAPEGEASRIVTVLK